MTTDSTTLTLERDSSTTNHDGPVEDAGSLLDGAGARVSDAMDAARSSASQLGERLPDVIDTVREGTIAGAKTINALPDPSQRLLGAFSLGLSLGLAIAGAPRLIVAAALAPAMFVGATIALREDGAS